MNLLKKINTIIFISLFLVGCAASRPNITIPKTMPAERQLSAPPRIALVLGGGGSRGATHAGVIKVLEDAHIPIDLIVGTSAGSLVGTMYADNPSRNTLLEKAERIKNKELLDFSIFHLFSDPISGYKLQSYLLDHLNAKQFSQLKIKTVVVATDQKTNQPFAIASGPIAPAVNASCAVPTVFRPVQLYGHTLVDGGVSAAVPVAIAKRYHPEIIIAVVASPKVFQSIKKGQRPKHIFAKNIKQQKKDLEKADVIISPAIGQFSAFDDHHNAALILAGEKAAKAALPKIKRLMAKNKIAYKDRSW